jgi:hypothetical protein
VTGEEGSDLAGAARDDDAKGFVAHKYESNP